MVAKKSIGYDEETVGRILSHPAESRRPIRQAANGDLVIYYGGWSLRDLRDSPAGKRLLDQQHGYDKYAWSTVRLPCGFYSLRIPLPDSNRKTTAQQMQMLSADESVAPVVLVTTALLVYRLETGRDLLNGDWIRCKEELMSGRRVVLAWAANRLYLPFCDSDSNDGVWLSSVRDY